jgi:hypothetical protein
MEQAGAATFPTDNKVLNWPGGDEHKRPERCAVDGGTGGLYTKAATRVCSFDRTVVIVDEAHNLFFPAESAVLSAGGNIDRLRRRLHEAHGSVVVFFTATPVLTGDRGTKEAREVLDFVKGHEFRNADSDEGFVSWYMERPRELFAATRPPQIADIVAQNAAPNLYRVPINRGAADGARSPWAWRRYVHLRYGEAPPRPWQTVTSEGEEDSHPALAYDPASRKHYLVGKKPSKTPGAAPKKSTAGVKKPTAPAKKPSVPAAKPKKKPVAADYGNYVFGAPITTKWKLPPKAKAKKKKGKKSQYAAAKKKAPYTAASHNSFRARLRSPGDDRVRTASHGNDCVATDRCEDLWSIHEHLWFDPRVTSEEEAIVDVRLTPDNATELAPKLAAIAQSVRDDEVKTLVLIHEAYGALVLWHLLREHGVDAILLRRPEAPDAKKKNTKATSVPRGAFPPAATAFSNWKQLLAFNALNNLNGRKCRVAVAVVEEFGEGVSFLGVRRVVIASLSGVGEKPRWPLVQQWIARALRMCSHADLKAELRTLTVDLFVASSDHARYNRTLDEQRLEFLRKEIRGVNAGMQVLQRAAIDDGMYEPAKGWFSWLRWK